MPKQYQAALTTLAAALVIGAVAQAMAKQEAAILGLSSLELALLGAGAGSLVKRYC